MMTLHGVVPIIPIPFLADESIDEASLRAVVEWVASRNLAGLALPAYGSEFYKLSEVEREQVLAIAIEVNAGRVPVVAQANHGSSRIASGLARQYESMGADVISFAIPRQFGATDADLLHFCGTIADAVSIPVLIQDFNPGGPTIDAKFIDDVHRQHGNFKYAKLEEPLIVDKLDRITDTVGDAVGILQGWGGYYMLEAISHGIVGIMPGVPYADLLDLIYTACESGEDDRAYELFGAVLPMIAFTLQELELFLRVEKRILVRRGILQTEHVRSLTYPPSDALLQHADYLTDQLFRVLEREGLV